MSRAGANGAAVADGGVVFPLVAMEPKDPAVEEEMPAVDHSGKDPTEDSISEETEKAPTGGLQEVDTKQTATVEAARLDLVGNSVSLERKVDDVAGLVEAQDEQLDPNAEAGEKQEAEEKVPASAEQEEEKPNEATSASHGEHCYQPGDCLDGIVNCINLDGVWLSHGGLRVLIPVKEDDLRHCLVGDEVHGEVQYVEDDGTLVLDSFLTLERDDDGTSASDARRWKRGTPDDQWWNQEWWSGQWDQSPSSYDQSDWKGEAEWQCHGWSPDRWIAPEEWAIGSLEQFYGEKIFAMLGELDFEEDYRGKITGMILERSVDTI